MKCYMCGSTDLKKLSPDSDRHMKCNLCSHVTDIKYKSVNKSTADQLAELRHNTNERLYNPKTPPLDAGIGTPGFGFEPVNPPPADKTAHLGLGLNGCANKEEIKTHHDVVCCIKCSSVHLQFTPANNQMHIQCLVCEHAIITARGKKSEGNPNIGRWSSKEGQLQNLPRELMCPTCGATDVTRLGRGKATYRCNECQQCSTEENEEQWSVPKRKTYGKPIFRTDEKGKLTHIANIPIESIHSLNAGYGVDTKALDAQSDHVAKEPFFKFGDKGEVISSDFHSDLPTEPRVSTTGLPEPTVAEQRTLHTNKVYELKERCFVGVDYATSNSLTLTIIRGKRKGVVIDVSGIQKRKSAIKDEGTIVRNIGYGIQADITYRRGNLTDRLEELDVSLTILRWLNIDELGNYDK